MTTYTPSTLSLRRAVAARIDEALSRDIEHASTLSLRRAVAARGAVAGRSARADGVATPRSELLRRVLGCLGDHPHDDTIDRVTRRLGLVSADAVEAALTALEHDSLVTRAGDHWQLTRHGWAVSRAADAHSDNG